ncbi:MAG TPA: rhomboid family intramembrane serine protease [Steroidobacteraceae bacterium]|nr:rhomboid family intramembrane serine protease [Steroidobacteraceae bacterium]
MTPPSSDLDGSPQSAPPPAVVFRGRKASCQEFSLVLEARGIEHEMQESAGTWVLTVAPALAYRAHEELSRYEAERDTPRRRPNDVKPFGGAAAGALGYMLILLLVAYCAGKELFGVDWLSAGGLEGGSRDWWRALTALTLHLDQEHLLGNLLFGAIAGLAAGRLLGPGVAWASILAAAAAANSVEMFITAATYRAAGASTAVFAALGLLAGLAWRQRLPLRERLWYRWAPLIAGASLLTLLGAGTAHVDVLGHALGFLCGVGVGWFHARHGIPRNRGRRLQIATAIGAAALLCTAWYLALRHAV